MLVQCRGIEAKQGARDPAVADVELRGLHEATQPVRVPRGQALDEEQPLQQHHVVADRWTADLKRRGEIAHVQEPRALTGRKREEPREHVEGSDPREVASVALKDRLDVIAIPRRATGGCRPRECGRISTCHDACTQVFSESSIVLRRESVFEQRIEETGPTSCELALRQRVQPQDFHPSCQRIGQAGNEQHVRRSGQEEPARSTVSLIAVKRTGTRWTSSRMTRSGRSAVKPIGSAVAAPRVTASSKVK